MKVLYLLKDENWGKTTTLNHLIEILAKFPVKVKERNKKIFSYHDYTIGIGTAGDDKKCIEETMEFFKNNNCKIGVIPIRKNKDRLRDFFHKRCDTESIEEIEIEIPKELDKNTNKEDFNDLCEKRANVIWELLKKLL